MQIAVENGRLQVVSEESDTLHGDAFETWREADELLARVRNEYQAISSRCLREAETG